MRHDITATQLVSNPFYIIFNIAPSLTSIVILEKHIIAIERL